MKMKNKNKQIIIHAIGLLFLVTISCASCKKNPGQNISHAEKYEEYKGYYTCSMHPQVHEHEPGNCPICGMTLVFKEEKHVHENRMEQEEKNNLEENSEKETGKQSKTKAKRKIQYYRNPMDPRVTSPTPMKDSMGMDYVPVYESEDEGVSTVSTSESTRVTISAEKQQMIGVTTEAVKKMDLTKIVRVSGKIAYDPDLVIKQEEYIQSLNTADSISDASSEVVNPVKAVTEAARRKLKLLGMSDHEIAVLARTRHAQTNLYLPARGENVWAYLSVYEYEFGLVKPGASVDIEAVAYPGEIFHGVVRSINPVLDSATRTGLVRVDVSNPDDKLKPEMFVTGSVKVSLGKKIAVPETAVLDTGLRKIVYLVKNNNVFESREVRLGQKARNYYEVLQGLNAGDIVVTSGNFLVDSESRLQNPAK